MIELLDLERLERHEHPVPSVEDEYLTVRDHFAGKAIEGMCAAAPTLRTIPSLADEAARAAYRIADAMMKARAT